MANNVLKTISERQTSLSGEYRTTLEDLIPSDWCRQFKCLYEDEVAINSIVNEEPVPPIACSFNPDGIHGNLLSLADEEGVVRLLDTRHPLTDSLITEWSAHHNSLFDVRWISENKLIVASGDRNCSLWDVNMVHKGSIGLFKGHKASVRCIDIKQDSPDVFVSGGRDGHIITWDMRCFSKDGVVHSPTCIIDKAHHKFDTPSKVVKQKKTAGSSDSTRVQPTPSDTNNGVTAVLFYKDNLIASAGSADGTVKLWDMRHLSSSLFTFFSSSSPNPSKRVYGFTSLITDPYHGHLYGSCMNDIIYVFDGTRLRNPDPVGGFSGHQASFYVKTSFSPCGRYLLSGSKCGNGFIWDVTDPQAPPTLLTGQENEITAVCWSPNQFDKVTNNIRIVTCSDECNARIWRCGSMTGPVLGTSIPYTGTGHQKFGNNKASRVALKAVENINHATSNGHSPSSSHSPSSNAIMDNKSLVLHSGGRSGSGKGTKRKSSSRLTGTGRKTAKRSLNSTATKSPVTTPTSTRTIHSYFMNKL